MKRLLVAVVLVGLIWAVPLAAHARTTSTSGPSWAVVNVDGTLARSRDALSSGQLGVDGQYQVIFNKDVSQCAYTASGGTATAVEPDDAVVFTVAPLAANPDGVFVLEYDTVLVRDSYSSGFHLLVAC